MTSEGVRIVKTEILPPDSHELRMPAGTPLGLGILGAARFSAIRRVLDHAARAAHAKANLHIAEAAIARAIVWREVAREQLRNIDIIREEEANRITEGAQIAKLRRQLERMELEDQVFEAEARRAKLRTSTPNRPNGGSGTAQDEFTAFIRELQKVPDLAKAISSVKEQIVRNAGGEDKVCEADRQVCELLDSMFLAFMSKKAGETAL
jgi:hypothetical protein